MRLGLHGGQSVEAVNQITATVRDLDCDHLQIAFQFDGLRDRRAKILKSDMMQG